MEDPRPEVRQAAARALWDLKPPHEKLAPALSKALNDDDPQVVGHVIDSLASLGAKIAPRVSEALADPKRRPKALAIIERMGPEAKACVPALVKLLPEVADEQKVHVLMALAAIGPDAAAALPHSPRLSTTAHPRSSARRASRWAGSVRRLPPACQQSKNNSKTIRSTPRRPQPGRSPDRTQPPPGGQKGVAAADQIAQARRSSWCGSRRPRRWALWGSRAAGRRRLRKVAADPNPAVSQAANMALTQISQGAGKSNGKPN